MLSTVARMPCRRLVRGLCRSAVVAASTLVLALFLSSGAAVLAQLPTGPTPFATIAKLPEGMVDLGDLDFHIVVPVVFKAGRGMPFEYALSYDSDFLYPNGTTWAWPQFLGWGNVGPSSGTVFDNPKTWLCTY